MKKGRWARRGNEVVVGQGLATSKSMQVGDTLRTNGMQFKIVGVANYPVTIRLAGNDPNLRPGMAVRIFFSTKTGNP